MRGSHEGRAKKKYFYCDAHNFWSKASYKPPLREYFLDIAALAHTPKKNRFWLELQKSIFSWIPPNLNC